MSSIHGVRSSANLINFLYDTAKAHLNQADCKWVNDCSDFVIIELDSLCRTLENTANLIMNDKTEGTFDGPENNAILLYSIKHQIETLSAYLSIGKDAADRLNNWEFYRQLDAAEARAAAKARSASQTTDQTKPA